jgi:tripartite-type tricarboxylate transporter receptor subunit TctC
MHGRASRCLRAVHPGAGAFYLLYDPLDSFPDRSATVHALIRLMLKLVFASLVSALPLVAIAADAFPNRPVRLMVPYPAGGPNDVLARMVGGKLGEGWGQQVVIENRPGAGGNLAMELASRAAPDGYTMVLPAMAYAVNP